MTNTKLSQKEREDFANIRREMLHRNDKYGLLALDRIEKTIAELRGENAAIYDAMVEQVTKERKKVAELELAIRIKDGNIGGLMQRLVECRENSND